MVLSRPKNSHSDRCECYNSRNGSNVKRNIFREGCRSPVQKAWPGLEHCYVYDARQNTLKKRQLLKENLRYKTIFFLKILPQTDLQPQNYNWIALVSLEIVIFAKLPNLNLGIMSLNKTEELMRG